MPNRIFYWKDSKWMMIDYSSGPGLPTLEDFKRDYCQLPEFNIVTQGTPEEQAGELFARYNADDNPMGTPEMQKWIGENLGPSPHTSMSVGDIVEVNGDLYIVRGVGWEKLPFDLGWEPEDPTNPGGALDRHIEDEAEMNSSRPFFLGEKHGD